MYSEVVNYYRSSAWLYKYFWYSKRSLGLHYGLWWNDTKTHDEALLNQFKKVVEIAKIGSEMKVLDAGCGVGGGAIYIVSQTGAQVVGITITPDQIITAEDNAKKSGVKNKALFELMDFTKTTFPNNHFDVVFAIESACYAYPKRLLLNEVYRILKPGGVVVISDGYTKRTPSNTAEQGMLVRFCAGWRLRELILVNKMTQEIQKAKFIKLKVLDNTKYIQPSLDRMKILVKIAQPLVWLANFLNWSFFNIIRDNALSMHSSIEGVRVGLMGYYMHIARK